MTLTATVVLLPKEPCTSQQQFKPLEHTHGEIREADPDIRDEGPPQQDVEPGAEDLVETGQADGPFEGFSFARFFWQTNEC